MARSEYSEYVLHVCSHMRLVCYTYDTEMIRVGWYHISKNGVLENHGQPCQASIHRITDFEWPVLTIDLTLYERDEDENLTMPTPDTLSVAQQIEKQRAT